MDNDGTAYPPPTCIRLDRTRLLRRDTAALMNRQVSRVMPTPCATPPLLVLWPLGSPQHCVLLDGHVRYQILRQRGTHAAPCRISEEIRDV